MASEIAPSFTNLRVSGYYCKRCRSSDDHSCFDDCPKLQCLMCQTLGHFVSDCPWKHKGVPPGTKATPYARIVCMCCHERVHYLESLLTGQPCGAGAYANFKHCYRCSGVADHETPLCPFAVRDRLCRDANFDPRKHLSFYVEGLPSWASELDLYRHLRKADHHLPIEDLVVDPGKGLGYVTFVSASPAADAFKWGNGDGAVFDDQGTTIKCHPCSFSSEILPL